MGVGIRDVGIRELKAKLSEYVNRAASGEQIVVTSRGKPVARLVGIEGMPMIERGIKEGWVTPASRTGLEPPSPFPARRSIAEVLDEDRG